MVYGSNKEGGGGGNKKSKGKTGAGGAGGVGRAVEGEGMDEDGKFPRLAVRTSFTCELRCRDGSLTTDEDKRGEC